MRAGGGAMEKASKRPMKLPKGLDLVIFDCDGVLVDSEFLAMRAYQDLFAELGGEVSVGLWRRCLGKKQDDILAVIEQTVGRVAPPELRATLWPRVEALFAAELKPTPGLVPFLEALEARRCVASSSDLDRIRFSLKVAGLARFFDGDLFSGRDVARGKPAPDIFLYAARKMGVAPEAALVIEDSSPGVLAARAAGAKVVGYVGGAHVDDNSAQQLIDAGARAVAASWREVAEFLGEAQAIGL
jgi:HAD superfamily hydrolase (TIGR01509 family)